MSDRRKRCWQDLHDIEVGDYALVVGDMGIVVKTEKDLDYDWGCVTFANPANGKFAASISYTLSERDGWAQIKVPRHCKPMFPGSRNDILGRVDSWVME